VCAFQRGRLAEAGTSRFQLRGTADPVEELLHLPRSRSRRSDPLRPNICRYRDWVIDAFNRNLPSDQFTIEQLAGDLLTNATQEQRIKRSGF